MGIINPSSSGDAPVVPDGLYVVTCVGAEEHTVEGDQFGNNEKVELHIQFETVDGDEVQLDPRCNAKWSEKATLFKWAIAFGLPADPNVPFDTDSFKGKKAQAVIHTETEGSWPRVQSFMPYKQASPARSTKVTEPSERKPGVLLPDGTVDWTLVWKEVKRLGMTRESVAAQFDGDIGKLTAMDGIDVAVWLDELQNVTA